MNIEQIRTCVKTGYCPSCKSMVYGTRFSDNLRTYYQCEECQTAEADYLGEFYPLITYPDIIDGEVWYTLSDKSWAELTTSHPDLCAEIAAYAADMEMSVERLHRTTNELNAQGALLKNAMESFAATVRAINQELAEVQS